MKVTVASKVPPLLYKYLPPARIDVLQNLRIRFTQVSALNDPFESLPGATLESEAWYRQRFQSKIELELQQLVDVDRKRRRALERSRWKEFRQFFDFYTNNERLANFSESIQRMLGSVHSVLSLSANCTNILMWSHYSLNHTGFAMGFDSSHEYFIKSVAPVNYTTVRPKVSPFPATENRDLFFTKSTDWAYEQEYRKFLPLDDQNPITTVGPNPLFGLMADGSIHLPRDESKLRKVADTDIRLFSIPPDSVRCVILGWKSSPELRRNLTAALNGHGLTAIPLLRAAPSLTEYRMEVA